MKSPWNASSVRDGVQLLEDEQERTQAPVGGWSPLSRVASLEEAAEDPISSLRACFLFLLLLWAPSKDELMANLPLIIKGCRRFPFQSRGPYSSIPGLRDPRCSLCIPSLLAAAAAGVGSLSQVVSFPRTHCCGKGACTQHSHGSCSGQQG